MTSSSGESGCGNGSGAASPHVVLVPLPVQGHLNPFSSLAHCLAASGISVTLVRAARANAIVSEIQGSAASSPLPHVLARPIRVEVVPDGMTSDPKQPLNPNKVRESIEIIGKGVDGLLEKLMREKDAPCCLIIDHLIGWGHDIALKYGLPWMMLWMGSASAFSVGFHVPELVSRGYIPAVGEGAKDRMIDFVPGLSPFSVRDVPKPVRIEEDPKANPFFQFFMSIYYKAKYADRILFDSVYDLESSVAEALREEAGFSVCHVGPLFMMSSQTSKSSARTVNLLQEDDSCLSWLDKQQESSVLYISFGSVVTLEYDVISELASGLEASGLHFLWVIRPDALSGKASVEELLPEGFIDRTHSRGCVISWAPQLAVLAHPSIGAFLTHCGWNSVLESLSHGVPMLGFPQQAEQNTNLKFIVHDWKVGLPLLQPNMQRIEHTYVQDAMTVIMKKDEGKEVRRNALHFKKVILNACNGSSKSNLEKLVQDFISGNLKAPAPLL